MNRQPIEFFVQGNPCGQPRIKASSRGGFVRCYTPTTVKNKAGKRKEHPATTWKKQVIASALLHRNQMKWDGPICLNLTFYFQRPQGHFRKDGTLKPNAPKWHISKPDRDNCDKLIEDALTQAGIWVDDKLVCAGSICKFYTESSVFVENLQLSPGCKIEIKEAV
jgi:Holliday junction resolvase RusA-like endonuclease